MRTLSKWYAMFALVIAACGICASSATAQTTKKSPPSTSTPAPQPFGLTLGKATLSDDQAVWEREGATVTGWGYGDAKPSYVDNDPDGVANERVVLIDVEGLPLERLQSARFGFFDTVLYLVKYEFQDGADFDKIYLQVSAKYGAPQRRGGFGDKVFEWRFGQVVLTLEKKFIGQHTMVFLHKSLLRNVRTSHSEVYAKHIKDKAQKQKGF